MQSADQRGLPRPIDFASIANATGSDGSDIGAFELQSLPPPPVTTPSPPVTTPPGDTGVWVRINNKRLRMNVRRGVVLVSLTCPRSEVSPPCRGLLVLKTRPKFRVRKGKRQIVLAKRRFRIAAGRTARVGLRLGKRKARLVRRNRRARRTITIARVRDSAGNRRTMRKGLRVAPRKPSRKRGRR